MFQLILAAALSATPPPKPIPRNPCTPADSCRYVDTFPIRDASGVHPVVVQRWLPYLAGGRLQLLPGEVVSLSLTDAGPVVTAATVLTSEDRDSRAETAASTFQKQTEASGKELLGHLAVEEHNPALLADKDSIRVAFLQAEGGAMVLHVASGYDRLLDYRAFINRPGRAKSATTVCSVLAQKTSIETWPPPIVSIELGEFKLLPPDAKADCR